MTDYLQKCLDYIQEKWQGKEFTEVDVFPHIKRGSYNLDRLVKLGKLKSNFKTEGKLTEKYYSLRIECP